MAAFCSTAGDGRKIRERDVGGRGEKRTLTLFLSQGFNLDQEPAPLLAVHVGIGDFVADLLQVGKVREAGVESLRKVGQLGAQAVGDFAERRELHSSGSAAIPIGMTMTG